MKGPDEKIELDAAAQPRPRSRLGLVSIICSGLAVVMMAFLIPFGITQSCSPTNIVTFIVLLLLSGTLAAAGTIMGAISYRRNKNRLSLISVILIIVYIALLLFLIYVIYF